MAKYEISDTLYITTCCTCGIVFGIPDHFDNAKRHSGDTWYCPNGHKLVYTKGKNLADWKKLADERETQVKDLQTKLLRSQHRLEQMSMELSELRLTENPAEHEK